MSESLSDAVREAAAKKGKARSPEQVLASFNESFEENELGCWMWTRSTSAGYGQMRENGSKIRAHRWSYKHFVGSIPDGMFVCHKCDVRACVNPDHLEIGSPSKNTKDAFDRGRIVHWCTRKEFCKRGHKLPEPNARGQRQCKICERLRRKSKRSIELARARNARYRERKTQSRIREHVTKEGT